jgi:hypothetical protein
MLIILKKRANVFDDGLSHGVWNTGKKPMKENASALPCFEDNVICTCCSNPSEKSLPITSFSMFEEELTPLCEKHYLALGLPGLINQHFH